MGAEAPAPRRKRPARVLLVDDHELARAGLRYVLERQAGIEVVGEAATGEQALELSTRLQPDLILMDVRMPGMGGLAATRAVKAQRPETSVIIMTMYASPEYLAEALKAGAGGYLLKDATHQEVVDAVRQVLSGGTPFTPRLLRDLLRRIGDGGAGGAAPVADTLTAREREVLRLVVQGRTNKEIGRALVITPGTAKSHVERIIRKFGVADRTQVAVQAVRLGLVSVGD